VLKLVLFSYLEDGTPLARSDLKTAVEIFDFISAPLKPSVVTKDARAHVPSEHPK